MLGDGINERLHRRQLPLLAGQSLDRSALLRLPALLLCLLRHVPLLLHATSGCCFCCRGGHCCCSCGGCCGGCGGSIRGAISSTSAVAAPAAIPTTALRLLAVCTRSLLGSSSRQVGASLQQTGGHALLRCKVQQLREAGLCSQDYIIHHDVSSGTPALPVWQRHSVGSCRVPLPCYPRCQLLPVWRGRLHLLLLLLLFNWRPMLAPALLPSCLPCRFLWLLPPEHPQRVAPLLRLP